MSRATRKPTRGKATGKPRRTAASRPARRRAKPSRTKPARSSRPKPPAPAPPPAFAQAVGASAKHRLLFDMVRARAAVLAAVQGMSAAVAEQPLGEGKWSTRETILHLVARDRARLREMEAALRGTPASWTGNDEASQALENERDLAPLRRLSWEDAVRLLLTTRQQLMESVESIPEEPAEVWDGSHTLGWMFERLAPHDRHHADLIKRWRAEPSGAAPPRTPTKTRRK